MRLLLKSSLLVLLTISLLLCSIVMIPSTTEAESIDESSRGVGYFQKPDGGPWPPDGKKSDVYANATWDTSINFDNKEVDPIENDINLSAHLESIKTGGGAYSARIYVTALSTSQWDIETGHDWGEMADLQKISFTAEQGSVDYEDAEREN